MVSIAEKVAPVLGGNRPYFDCETLTSKSSSVIYVPYGCPDWGEKDGKRLDVCVFCQLPGAAEDYRQAFYGGSMSDKDYIDLFQAALETVIAQAGSVQVLQIFNAGSFLAMPRSVQLKIAEDIARYPCIEHVVIESRVVSRGTWLITDEATSALCTALGNRKLTIRIGIETKDPATRIVTLKKGHPEAELIKGAAILRRHGVVASGYVMLLTAGIGGFNDESATEEACTTIDWILTAPEQGGLGMDEVCFRPFCIEPNTPLTDLWRRGAIRPATPWMVYGVLERTASHGRRIILLPFAEEPPFAAIPSNHIPRGMAQDLSDAAGCDREFYELLDHYRDTGVLLSPPSCSCCPPWLASPLWKVA